MTISSFSFSSIPEPVHCTSVEINNKDLPKSLVRMKTVGSVSVFSRVRASGESISCFSPSPSASTFQRLGLNHSQWCRRGSLKFGDGRKRILVNQVTRRPAIALSALGGQRSRSIANQEVCNPANFFESVLKNARKRFCDEVSFRVEDRNVSLAKTMLLIAAEDEAFISYNHDMDAHSVLSEGREVPRANRQSPEEGSLDAFLLNGKSITSWLSELDVIAKQVEAELVSKEIGCYLAEVLEAVNVVLFDLRGFTRASVLKDPKQSYLHTVLSSASGSAIMLSIIYIEVCRRLGVTIVGARIGEDFLIWPETNNTEELFKLSEGESWFARVNGNCVKHPGSKASDLDSGSLPSIELGSNRDITAIALANLKRLYWKCASKAHPGLMLTSPLRPVGRTSEKQKKVDSPNALILRPEELRLSIMASERLLILQPHNWVLRRDHGMLLYYSRRYGEAVQELSICMAFAPVEEAEILEPFVEKLHLIRVESSWKSMKASNTLGSRS